MVDIDMSILNNPDLGKSHLPFLDEIVVQADENRHAANEGRDPRRVLSRERFGPYAGLTENGPIVMEESAPNFKEHNLDGYFTDREIEKVAKELDREILPVEADLIEDNEGSE